MSCYDRYDANNNHKMVSAQLIHLNCLLEHHWKTKTKNTNLVAYCGTPLAGIPSVYSFFCLFSLFSVNRKKDASLVFLSILNTQAFQIRNLSEVLSLYFEGRNVPSSQVKSTKVLKIFEFEWIWSFSVSISLIRITNKSELWTCRKTVLFDYGNN